MKKKKIYRKILIITYKSFLNIKFDSKWLLNKYNKGALRFGFFFITPHLKFNLKEIIT